MRLVAAPSGAVDRTDRALWLTLGFDLSWGAATVRPFGVCDAPIGGWAGPAALACAALGGAAQGRVPTRAAAAGTVGREFAGAATAGAPGRELASAPAGGTW